MVNITLCTNDECRMGKWCLRWTAIGYDDDTFERFTPLENSPFGSCDHFIDNGEDE